MPANDVVSADTWVIVATLALVTCFVWMTANALEAYADAMQGVLSLRNDWTDKRIRWRLAKVGVTNDQVLDTLLALDEFDFVMDGKVCTCVRGSDGTHQIRERVPGETPDATAGRRAETV